MTLSSAPLYPEEPNTQEQSITEEWRPVVGWEGCYEVSSHGRLKGIRICNSHQFKRIRILKVNRSGYEVSCLFDGERRKDVSIHILVAEAFIGVRPAGLQVNHKDTNKRNNHFSNLEWLTPKANMEHAALHGLRPSGDNHARRRHPEKYVGARYNFGRKPGEENHNSKFTDDIVREIRLLSAKGIRQTEIAKKFNVQRGAVNKVLKGRSWTHVI